MKLQSAWPAIALVLLIFISGCTNQSADHVSGPAEPTAPPAPPAADRTPPPAQPPEPPKPTLAAKEPAALILDPDELNAGLPQSKGNYSIKERAPRLRSDVAEVSRARGWQDGYYVRFARIGDSLLDATVLQQWISIYPLENITLVLDSVSQEYISNENVTYEEMPSPKIGDKSQAWRITGTDELGNTARAYEIHFIRLNVYEAFNMYGTTTDYDVLKLVAAKAAAQIE
jgi:hypothetical protein